MFLKQKSPPLLNSLSIHDLRSYKNMYLSSDLCSSLFFVFLYYCYSIFPFLGCMQGHEAPASSISLLSNKESVDARKSKHVFGLIKLTKSLGEKQRIWFIILTVNEG